MQVEIDNINRIAFIHFNPQEGDNSTWLDGLMNSMVKALPDHMVIVIPNGKPILKTGKPSFYVCRNDEVTMRMIKKLAGEKKPGEMIPLDDEEWDAFNNNFKPIG